MFGSISFQALISLAIYHEFAREIKAWKEMEPNIFVALNRMKRS